MDIQVRSKSANLIITQRLTFHRFFVLFFFLLTKQTVYHRPTFLTLYFEFFDMINKLYVPYAICAFEKTI